MAARKKEEVAALVLSVVVISIYIIGVMLGWDMATWGISHEASWEHRLVFHFAHAGFVHVCINVWCLLSIASSFRVPMAYFVCAYILSSLCPCSFLGTIPTIGMSGICFALLGMVSWQARKVKYHLWMAAFIVLGFLPSIFLKRPIYNNLLHIYCYMAGVLVGFLNYPAPWRKNTK